MATVKNTKLTIAPGSRSDRVLVTVTTTVAFAPADEGSWMMSIKLYGQDKVEQGDLVLPGYSGNQLLYTFSFPTSSFHPFLKKDYTWLRATPGERTIVESREIERVKLDEDPKRPFTIPTWPPGSGKTTIYLPDPDEVLAGVTLSQEFWSNVCTGQDFGMPMIAKAQADSQIQVGTPTS